jgi:hypothetical protein
MTQDTPTTPVKDLVTIAEFRRRLLERDRLKDPLAGMVARSTILAKIVTGHLITEEHNGRQWVDWNTYKETPFRTYFQRPKAPEKRPDTPRTKREVIAIYSKPTTK